MDKCLPYKTYGGNPHTICMGEAESPPTWPYLTYIVHADHPRGRRKEEGSIGDPRRHGFPREVSKGAYRVERSGVAVYTTNRVRQCVLSPLSDWIHGGAAGDEYMWLFPT